MLDVCRVQVITELADPIQVLTLHIIPLAKGTLYTIKTKRYLMSRSIMGTGLGKRPR